MISRISPGTMQAINQSVQPNVTPNSSLAKDAARALLDAPVRNIHADVITATYELYIRNCPVLLYFSFEPPRYHSSSMQTIIEL